MGESGRCGHVRSAEPPALQHQQQDPDLDHCVALHHALLLRPLRLLSAAHDPPAKEPDLSGTQNQQPAGQAAGKLSTLMF